MGTTIDHLVEPVDDADVIIRPVQHQEPGLTTWVLSRDAAKHGGRLVAKMRIPPERRAGPRHLAGERAHAESSTEDPGGQ